MTISCDHARSEGWETSGSLGKVECLDEVLKEKGGVAWRGMWSVCGKRGRR